jgi:hypothetical protein
MIAAREWWAIVSGRPYAGWRRVAHSALVPLLVTVVAAKLADRIFG